MERIPPRTIKITSIVTIRPVFASEMPNVSLKEDAIELDCVIFPIPKDASTANIAYRQPNSFPRRLNGNPFSSVYIGPPTNLPLSFFVLYFTASILSANLVESPAKAAKIIQSSAPGPPSTMAEATPTIFPMPRVVASSVVREDREDIFPEEIFPEEIFPEEIFPEDVPESLRPVLLLSERFLSASLSPSIPRAHLRANLRFRIGKKSIRIIR